MTGSVETERMSGVAAIIERGGGYRIVVGPLANMWCHAGADERIVVLPGVELREPVQWGVIPNLIETVERFLRDGGHLNHGQRVAMEPSL